MAKFKYIEWLLEFLISSSGFIFEWDEGNSSKSEQKHRITVEMIEAIFDDGNILALGEQYHPICDEDRYGAIGKTYSGEVLFVCFTIRSGKIRVISSRIANKKERIIYDEEIC